MNRADAYHSLFLSWPLFSFRHEAFPNSTDQWLGQPKDFSAEFLCKKQGGCHIPYAPCREGNRSSLSFSIVFKIMLLAGMCIPKGI